MHGGKGLPAGGWATAREEAAGRIERIVQAIGDGAWEEQNATILG